MSKAKASIIIYQYLNPKFNDNQPVSADNRPNLYKVTKAVNTLTVEISEVLTYDKVQSLIDGGVQVTIERPH